MSFDLDTLRETLARRGPVIRVVVADTRGSVPREPGAAMLVWPTGQSGTIGGGALELAAAEAARRQLATSQQARVTRHPLGPGLGQCCGGAVTLVSERWDATSLDELGIPATVARRVEGDGDAPFTLRVALKASRGEGAPLAVSFQGGWLAEPVSRPTRQIWIHGAGHVGRALVSVLAPLPDLALTWTDTAAERFPDECPNGVTCLPAADPARVIPHAPARAEHFILTYSHDLDLRLCDALLRHGFRRCGLIGSKTKWARFRSRLAALGHRPEAIARINCPIGDPTLGKAPQQIAIGVAQRLLAEAAPAAKPIAPRQDTA